MTIVTPTRLTAVLPDGSKASCRDPIALTRGMTDVLYRAHVFAPASTPVVLFGESGTGKTFFAEYIHRLSERTGGFHAFGVGTMAPQLALDELFGHVPGAYTDARSMRTGRLTAASEGTLLLDDIQTLDLGVQKQLLQLLDRGTYSPVGSDRVMTMTCRIMLAMTEDPDVLMRSGGLLKDLRFRFGACAIRIPPLRERRAEIPLLAQRALERCPQRTGVAGPSRLTDGALDVLSQGDHEGNVRQLTAAVEYGYLMARAAAQSEIGPAHLPEELCASLRYQRHGDPNANRILADRTLRRTGGNAALAARLLGISRNAFNQVLAAPQANGTMVV